MPTLKAGTIPIRNLGGLTLTVKMTRELRLRVRIGIALIKIAAFVFGCNVEVQLASGGEVTDSRKYLVGENWPEWKQRGSKP